MERDPLFPIHNPEETGSTSDAIEKSVGAFILQFGKVEYALTVTIIQINLDNRWDDDSTKISLRFRRNV
jgi:hypothetical protein